MEQTDLRLLPPPMTPLRVISCPHPFSFERQDIIFPAGGTIGDILRAVNAYPPVGLSAHVFIDDCRVEREWWERVKPKAGHIITIRVVPRGRRGGKNVLAVVLQIALIVVGGIAGGALGGFLGGPLGMTIAGVSTVAVGTAIGGLVGNFVGSLIANAIAPPPKPKLSRLGGVQEAESSVLSITGTQNQANKYGPIPRLFGKHKVFPPYGAAPFTEILGNDQYLRLLFVVGYGPLQLSDLRIGDTPIGQFEGVEFQTREGAAGDAPLSLYSNNVNEEVLSVKLTQAGSWVTRRSRPNANELSVDIVFPQGLVKFDNQGNRADHTIQVDVEHQLVGAGSWTSAGSFNLTEKSSSVVRRGLRWTVTQGEYDVRLRRVTADSTDPFIRDEVFWTALRTIKHTDPVNISGLAKVALRIKATDQLNNVIDRFNLIAEAKLPLWDGSAWTSPQLTRHPAWAYAESLRGKANKRALADSRIDAAALKTWADATPARTFDAVVDFRATVFELLRDIAGSGRASFAMVEGKYSIVRDVQQTSIIQHFTPRNSWGYQGRKAFIDLPHALKVRFINPDVQWQQDERIVYDDGFNDTNASKFEVLELWGTINKDQAWKDGRYHIATGRLRPEMHEFNADIEHIVCTRGDLIRFTHDVPQFGLGWARIKSVQINGAANVTGITIDDKFTMEAGKSYSVRVRKKDGASLLNAINTVAGEQSSLIYSTSIPAANPKPEVGDLVMFGETGKESVELLVKEIIPSSDLSAKLVCIDHAPAVHSAESGTIPAFDSQISLPPAPLANQLPPAPIVDSMRSDEDVLVRGLDGSLEPRIVVSLSFKSTANVQPTHFQARYRVTGSGDSWIWLSPVAIDAGEISVSPVEEGVAYDLRIRSISALGLASVWTEINSHKVVGKTSNPPDVDSFFIEENLLKWLYPNKPKDFAGFKLRRHPGQNDHWGSGIDLHGGLISDSIFDISAVVPSGIQTLMLKALDTGGRESTNPAVIIKDLGDVIVDNLLVTKDYRADGWPGTITNGSIISNELKAAGFGAQFWSGNDTAIFWTLDHKTFWTEIYKAMEYLASFTPEATDVPSDLTLEAVVAAQTWSMEYRTDTPDLFWGPDSLTKFWSVDSALFWHPLPLFVPWPGQLVKVTRQKYEFKLKTGESNIQGVISQLKAKLDVPDIIERFNDFNTASGGSRLPITKTYRVIKNVKLTLQDDGGIARTVKIIDKDPALGPKVQAFDSAGAGTTGKIDAEIQGY